MGTSCNPFLGKKTYDDRAKVSTAPYNQLSWWRADPWCYPKRGDYVLFWFTFPTKDDWQRVLENIDTFRLVEQTFVNNEVYYVTGEGARYFMLDLKILVAFIKDAPKTLHDYGTIMESILSSYSEVDWIQYMGTDSDLPIVVVQTPRNVSGSIGDNIVIDHSITNYGRVPANIYYLFIEYLQSGKKTCLSSGSGITVEPNTMLKLRATVRMNEAISKICLDYRWDSDFTYLCSYYNKSPNSLVSLKIVSKEVV